jgi:regulation of enolase protein 1 (concanavalin A-like superfamily)
MIDFTFGKWIFEPKASQVAKGSVSITTEPETVFWQRYYCGFRNNNEAALQIESEDNY